MKINFSGLLFVGVALAGIGTLGCSGTGRTSGAGELSSATKTGRAMVTVRFDVSNAEAAQLPAGFLATVNKDGYIKTDAGFEKTVPAALAEVSDGSTTVKTDDDGYFTLPTTRASSAKGLEIVGDKSSVAIDKTPTRAVDGVTVWHTTIPYISCCKGMGMNDAQTEAATSRDVMDDQRCLDYNGWFSNHVNYPAYDPRAWKNFPGSDCAGALKYCITDHLYNGGCMARHNGCSSFIGHSQNAHWHNL